MSEAKEIIELIHEELAVEEEQVLNENTSLFRENLLDSISLVLLISVLEEKYSIKVSPTEVVLENFDTPGNISQFIARKTKDQ